MTIEEGASRVCDKCGSSEVQMRGSYLHCYACERADIERTGRRDAIRVARESVAAPSFLRALAAADDGCRDD